jgi:hypothetical protein
LAVAADGTVSEPTGPTLLSAAGVPGTAHPQGIAVVAGRGKSSPFGDDGPRHPANGTVYTESNNPAAGANAVLAFRQNADGTLTEIGSFNTGGTGDEARDGLKEIASFIARHLKR